MSLLVGESEGVGNVARLWEGVLIVLFEVFVGGFPVGYIPDDLQLLLQRMEDEQVRRALDRECNRQKIRDVLGMSRRTTFNKHKRACAYDFPLDAFYNRGGRPTDDERSERTTAATDAPAEQSNDQQRLDAVTEQTPDTPGRAEIWGRPDTEGDARTATGSTENGEPAVNEDGTEEKLRAHLRQAIDVLQEIEQAL